MGEIDHPQNSIDDGITHGNEGVDASLCQTEDQEIKPVVPGISACG